MPWWWSIINIAVFGAGMWFVIGFVLYLYSLSTRNLHMHRIPSDKELAARAMKSALLKNSTREAAMPFADVAFVVLCEGYDVAIPSKESRLHTLNSAYFDIHNG